MGETALIGCPETEGSESYCYRWLPEDGLNSPHTPFTEASPTETTTYTLYITDDNGDLIAMEEVVVTVIAPITAMITPQSVNVCPGTPVTLEVVVGGESEDLTYLWDTGETTASITVTPAVSKYYIVEVFDATSGCTVEAKTVVNLETTPSIQIISTAATICELANPGLIGNHGNNPRNSPEGCEKTSAWLYVGTGLPGYSYEWSTGATDDAITVDAAGVYTVTVTNPDNACLTVASYEVESCADVVELDPVISSNGEGVLDAGEGFISYLWHDGSTGQTIPLTGTGTYAVTVVNEAGCTGRGELVIDEFPNLNEIYLVFFTTSEVFRNIYIWNSLGAPQNATEKKSIEKVIGEYVQKFTGFEDNFFWGSMHSHSNAYPLIKNHTDNDFYPIIIKNQGNGVYTTEGNHVYLNQLEHKYKHHKFRLEIAGTTYELDRGAGRSFKSVALPATLPEMTTAQLSIKKADPPPPLPNEEYANAPAEHMVLSFKPEDPSDPNPFVLYYEDNPVPTPPASILIGERTFPVFRVKRMGSPAVDITHEIGSTVIEVKWYENIAQLLPQGANKGNISYKVPVFNAQNNGNNKNRIDAEIKVMGQSGVPIVHKVSAMIETTDVPVVPGYMFKDNFSHIPGACKGGDPEAYATQAKNTIMATPADLTMFQELINGRQIDIILMTTNDPEYIKNTIDGGTLYGYSSLELTKDARIQIDKNKVMKGMDPFHTCPTNAHLLLRINSSETYDEYNAIRAVIQNPNVSYENAPVIAKTAIMRIGEAYMDRASLLIQLCNDPGPNTSNSLDQFDELYNTRQLAYLATLEELDELIQVADYGEISLVVDHLCNVSRYGKACNSSQNWDWYLNATEQKIIDNESIQEARQRKYTSILAHEMGHTYHKVLDKIESCKWDLIEAAFPGIFKDRSLTNICYPERQNHSLLYCSGGGGHEYQNPDGLLSCEIEGHYPEPKCIKKD